MTQLSYAFAAEPEWSNAHGFAPSVRIRPDAISPAAQPSTAASTGRRQLAFGLAAAAAVLIGAALIPAVAAVVFGGAAAGLVWFACLVALVAFSREGRRSTVHMDARERYLHLQASLRLGAA